MFCRTGNDFRAPLRVRRARHGQLLPALAKQHDLRAWRNATKAFKPLPQFPAVRRDVAMLVPEATTHDAVLAAVKQAKPANLERVELFDVFRGKNVPERQKSLAYAFTYRHAERTRHRRRGERAAREARRPLQAGIAGDGARQLNALLTSQVAQFGAFSLPRPEDDVILSTNSHARSLLLLS